MSKTILIGDTEINIPDPIEANTEVKTEEVKPPELSGGIEIGDFTLKVAPSVDTSVDKVIEKIPSTPLKAEAPESVPDFTLGDVTIKKPDPEFVATHMKFPMLTDTLRNMSDTVADISRGVAAGIVRPFISNGADLVFPVVNAQQRIDSLKQELDKAELSRQGMAGQIAAGKSLSQYRPQGTFEDLRRAFSPNGVQMVREAANAPLSEDDKNYYTEHLAKMDSLKKSLEDANWNKVVNENLQATMGKYVSGPFFRPPETELGSITDSIAGFVAIAMQIGAIESTAGRVVPGIGPVAFATWFSNSQGGEAYNRMRKANPEMPVDEAQRLATLVRVAALPLYLGTFHSLFRKVDSKGLVNYLVKGAPAGVEQAANVWMQAEVEKFGGVADADKGIGKRMVETFVTMTAGSAIFHASKNTLDAAVGNSLSEVARRKYEESTTAWQRELDKAKGDAFEEVDAQIPDFPQKVDANGNPQPVQRPVVFKLKPGAEITEPVLAVNAEKNWGQTPLEARAFAALVKSYAVAHGTTIHALFESNKWNLNELQEKPVGFEHTFLDATTGEKTVLRNQGNNVWDVQVWKKGQDIPDIIAQLTDEQVMPYAGVLKGSGQVPSFDQLVYHGTPHTYQPEPGFPHGRPRLDKVGTGVDAQAYGWGWNSAESKSVGEGYKQSVKGASLNGLEPQEGNLLTLDLPDDIQGKLLEWDAPVSQKVKEQIGAAFQALTGKVLKGRGYAVNTGKDIYALLKDGFEQEKFEGKHGGKQNDQRASELLASIGIVGNKFLDQGSRDSTSLRVVEDAGEFFIIAGPKGTKTHAGPFGIKSVAEKYLQDHRSKLEKETLTYNYVIWDQPTLDRTALLERNGEKLDKIREQEEEFFQEGVPAKAGALAGTPYYLTAPRVLADPAKLKMPSNTPLRGDLILSRLASIPGVKGAELEFYKSQGIEEFLKEKRTVEEVGKWMEENGPKVEIKKIEATEPVNPLKIKEAELQHYFEGIAGANSFPSFVFDGRESGESSSITYYRPGSTGIGEKPKTVDPESEEFKKAQEWDSVQQQLSKLPMRERHPKGESATARYTTVNPKSLEEMPSAVDLLVKIPVKQTESAEEFAGRKSIRAEDKVQRPKAKYTSSHYDFPKPNGENTGDNLLTHVRGYMETLPDGRKVFHVFEVQSDWAQELRETKEKESNPNWSANDRKMEIARRQKMEDPLLSVYEQLALKAAIAHAQEQGADAIAISDAQTAMLTERHDQAARYSLVDTPENRKVIKKNAQKIVQRFVKIGRSSEGEMFAYLRALEDFASTGKAVDFSASMRGVMESFGVLSARVISQEQGMRLHYDRTLPKIAEKLTESKGEVVEFGEHKNALVDHYIDPQEDPLQGKPRKNLFLKNPDGTPQTTIRARMYSLENTAEDHSLFKTQDRIKLGSTAFLPTGEKLVKMFEGSNFSTAVHEFAHLVMPLLPAEHLASMLEWGATKSASSDVLRGIFSKNEIGEVLTKKEFVAYSAAHEKFASGLEEYIRQGKAPTVRLKSLFDYAKYVMQQIYQSSVEGLRISKDMRQVYDEMFFSEKERTTGTITVPKNAMLSSDGSSTVILPERTYQIQNVNGRAVIEMDPPLGSLDMSQKIQVQVDNIIKTGYVTKEQKELGLDYAKWESPYAVELKGKNFFDKAEYFQHTDEQLQKRSDAQLQYLAKKLGLRGYHQYSKEQLIEQIKIAEEAEVILSSKNVAEEDARYALSMKHKHVPSYKEKNFLKKIFEYDCFTLVQRVAEAGTGKHPLNAEYRDKGQSYIHSWFRYSGLQEKMVLDFQKFVRLHIGLVDSKGLSPLLELIPVKDEAGRVYAYTRKIVAYMDRNYVSLREGELSPESKIIVEKLRQFLDLQAEIAQVAGISIKVVTNKGTKKNNFKDKVEEYRPLTPVGEVFPRIYTQDFWAMLMHPNNIYRKRLAMAVGVANHTDPQTAERWVGSMYKAMQSKNARMYMEAQRMIPIMPTHIRGSGGLVYEILHTEPFTYVEKLQRKLSSRAAFFETFGVPIEEGSHWKKVESKDLDKRVKDFKAATTEKDADKLVMMFRAMNDMPITDSFRVAPGTLPYTALGVLQNISMLRRAALLTKAWVPNLPETIKLLSTAGAERTAKVFGKVAAAYAKSPFQLAFTDKTWDETTLGHMRDEMLRSGGYKQQIAHFIIDPKDTMRSLAQNASSLIVKLSGTQAAMGFNEFFSAMVGHEFSRDLQIGNFKPSDARRLQTLGFNDKQIADMLAGKSDRETRKLYDAVEAMMSAMTQGSTTPSVMKSQSSHLRYGREFMPFMQYMRTTAFLMYSTARPLYLARDSKIPAEKYGAYRDAATVVGTIWDVARDKPSLTLIAALTVNGLIAAAIRQSIGTGFKSFLWNNWGPDEDETATGHYSKMLAWYVSQGFLSGVPANILANIQQNKFDPAEWLHTIFAYDTMADLTTAILGNGRYKGYNALERPLHYAYNNTSVAPTIASLVTMMHLGNLKDTDLAYASAKVFEFKNKKGAAWTGGSFKIDSSEQANFHREMRLAFETIGHAERNFKLSQDPRQKNKAVFLDANVHLHAALKWSREEAIQEVKQIIAKRMNVSTDKVKLGRDFTEADVSTVAKRQVARAIRNKMLLPRIPLENREEFERWVKPPVLKVLKQHDYMLKWWASSVSELNSEEGEE